MKQPSVLLVSYAFPPVAGLSPQRVLRLSIELVERGYEVSVVTARVSPYDPRHRVDETLAASIPQTLQVLRAWPGPAVSLLARARQVMLRSTKVRRPHDGATSPLRRTVLSGVASWVYRRAVKPFLVPDVDVEWYPFAWRAAVAAVVRQRPVAVYTLAYPFTAHFIGRALKRRFGLRWVADYGDPWVLNPMSAAPCWRRWLDTRLEESVLRNADRVFFATPETKEAYLTFYRVLDPARASVAYWGYEPVEFEPCRVRPSERCRIVYTGTFGIANRSVARLLEVLAHPDLADCELIVAGLSKSEAEQSLATKARELGVGHRVSFRGFLPREEMIALQQAASVLLLWGWPGGMQVPGKLFEYFGAGRPILVIAGDERDPSVRLVRQLNRGFAVPDEAEELRTALGTIRDAWRRGELDSQFDLGPLRAYTWKQQVGIIANALTEQ